MKLIFKIIILLVALLFSYFSISYLFQTKNEVEKELCKPSFYSSDNESTYEMMKVEKCTNNTLIIYKKDQNTDKRTDSGITEYFDENGTKTCKYSWFAHNNECEENIKNNYVNFEKCSKTRICTIGLLWHFL